MNVTVGQCPKPWPFFTCWACKFSYSRAHDSRFQSFSSGDGAEDNRYPDDLFPRDAKCDLWDELASTLQWVHEGAHAKSKWKWGSRRRGLTLEVVIMSALASRQSKLQHCPPLPTTLNPSCSARLCEDRVLMVPGHPQVWSFESHQMCGSG